MFDQTFVNAHVQRRPWTLALSVTVQTALVATLLIVPILHVTPLDVQTKLPVWVPLHQVEPPVKPEVRASSSHTPLHPVFPLDRLIAPTRVLPLVGQLPDAPEIGLTIGPALASSGPVLPGMGLSQVAPPAQAVKPEAAPIVKTTAPAAPMRVSVGVQSAKLMFGPKPPYPVLAKTTGTQGTVKIQALIGRDGVIRNLQLVSGPPLLVKAAMDAVAQWRYQPTLLNGEAVEVITEIDVNFTLNR